MPKLYADTTARRTVQIVSDVFVVCWVALSIWLGRTVDNGISELQQRGLRSPFAKPGRLSHAEPLVHTFGNWVLDHVLGVTS